MELSAEQAVLLHFLVGLVKIHNMPGESTIMNVLKRNEYNMADKFIINFLKNKYREEIERWYYPERYE